MLRILGVSVIQWLDFHNPYLLGSCDNEENWLDLSAELKLHVSVVTMFYFLAQEIGGNCQILKNVVILR